MVALLDWFWENRANRGILNLNHVKTTEPYKKCKEIFNPPFEGLLDEQVNNMICDVRDFHLHDYCVVDGKIGYKDQD